VIGDTFAVSLGDGRHCAVRVLRTCPEAGTVLVALCPWIGRDPPRIEEPALRGILRAHRGRFAGRPELAWHDGSPPSEFVWFGRIEPTEEELSIDPMGNYGGAWHRSMIIPVLLESGEVISAELRSRICDPPRRVKPCDAVAAKIDEAAFWKIIDCVNRDAPSRASSIQEAVANLTARGEGEIRGFHELLRAKLAALNTEAHAKQIGSFALGSSDGFFSSDHFLDVRAAAVAMGRASYEEIVKDPRLMPKDRECEELLWIADRAWKALTGTASDMLYEDV
jgi:uncharacterized protein DUF4240